MTKMEIEKKINEIEDRRFLLAMKDHWTREDFRWDDKMYAEIKNLRKELQKLN